MVEEKFRLKKRLVRGSWMLQILKILAELLLGCSQNLQKTASKRGQKMPKTTLKVPAKMC
jgi:hypothetical protein